MSRRENLPDIEWWFGARSDNYDFFAKILSQLCQINRDHWGVEIEKNRVRFVSGQWSEIEWNIWNDSSQGVFRQTVFHLT